MFADVSHTVPAVDGTRPWEVTENDREVVVRCELGWVVPGSLRVQRSDDLVEIEAERPSFHPFGTHTPADHASSTFKQVIALPHGHTYAEAQASYGHGVLTIRLPRAS